MGPERLAGLRALRRCRALRRPLGPALALLTALSSTATAQSEGALRAALEGRTVTVKIEMPGTAKGIDVFPLEAAPVNWREVADRLKSNGTALRIGQPVMITKVVVNRGSHIEVQLGGGGYGTFGDQTGSAVYASEEGETTAERALRDSIRATPAGPKRKQFESTLNGLRNDRDRRNARLRAEAAQANEAREANLRVKRAEGGSRFNVRYRNGLPDDALTPASVMAALAPFVDFGGAPMPSPMGPAMPAGAGTPSRGSLLGLKKGLSLAEVEALLGPAITASESKEGTLTVLKRGYRAEGNRIATAFVNDVLIDFAITPM